MFRKIVVALMLLGAFYLGAKSNGLLLKGDYHVIIYNDSSESIKDVFINFDKDVYSVSDIESKGFKTVKYTVGDECSSVIRVVLESGMEFSAAPVYLKGGLDAYDLLIVKDDGVTQEISYK